MAQVKLYDVQMLLIRTYGGANFHEVLGNQTSVPANELLGTIENFLSDPAWERDKMSIQIDERLVDFPETQHDNKEKINLLRQSGETIKGISRKIRFSQSYIQEIARGARKGGSSVSAALSKLLEENNRKHQER